MTTQTPPDAFFLDIVAALLLEKVHYMPSKDYIPLAEDPDFKKYFPALSDWQQFLILTRILYNARGRWSWPEKRIGVNKILALAGPALDKDGILEKYAINGYITVYRGTDAKETAKALSGDVEDLGYCWSFDKNFATRYACSHRTRGRVLAITIPARCAKYLYGPILYAIPDSEVDISAPEVWPEIKDLQVYKIRWRDVFKDRRNQRKEENNTSKNLLQFIKDLHGLRIRREQSAKDLDNKLDELAKQYFFKP